MSDELSTRRELSLWEAREEADMWRRRCETREQDYDQIVDLLGQISAIARSMTGTSVDAILRIQDLTENWQ